MIGLISTNFINYSLAIFRIQLFVEGDDVEDMIDLLDLLVS